jgi:hypothetical protein
MGMFQNKIYFEIFPYRGYFMWAILLFLFLGMLIGYFKEFSKKGKKINGILQQIGVFYVGYIIVFIFRNVNRIL